MRAGLDRLREHIAQAWTGHEYGPGNENSVDKIIDALDVRETCWKCGCAEDADAHQPRSEWSRWAKDHTYWPVFIVGSISDGNPDMKRRQSGPLGANDNE